ERPDVLRIRLQRAIERGQRARRIALLEQRLGVVGDESRLPPVGFLRAPEARACLGKLAESAFRASEQIVEPWYGGQSGVLPQERARVRPRRGGLSCLQERERVPDEQLRERDARLVRLPPRPLRPLRAIGV